MGVSKLMIRMWEDEVFQQSTREIANSPEFQGFIGHVLTDLNYCMSESFQKMPKTSRNPSKKGKQNKSHQDCSGTKPK